LEKQLITFFLSGEEYGIDILEVDGIQRLKEISITKVPQTDSYIKGIINLRGNVIPLIDLQERFDLGTGNLDKDARIIVVYFKEKLLGLLVDRVDEVVDIEVDSIEEPPEEIVPIENKYLSGIAKFEEKLVIILDIEKILSEKAEKEILEMTDSLV